jgi:thymidylate kinase
MDRLPARIIIEGMDGSGKSTLAAQLNEHIEGSIILRNEVGPRPDIGEWWMQTVNESPAPVVIHDRFFYPEFVYGPILRGTVRAYPGDISYVSRIIRNFCFLVYCRPEADEIRVGAEGKEQWPGVMDHFQALLEAYDGLMMGEVQWYGNRFFRYDWHRDEAFPVLATAIDMWRTRHFG